MSCKYNNCKHCGYKSECEIYKENAELKRHIKADCIDCADYYKNKRLEKENAELKSNRDYWKGSSIYWHKQLKNKKYRKIAKATQQQLTKAKEIIHKVCYEYGIYDKDLMEEAKQFLKECK